MSAPEHAPYQLLVEGADDRHVVYALAMRHQLREGAFEVTESKGDAPLVDSLRLRLKLRRSFERLGVVLDADVSLADRWHALRQLVAASSRGALPEEPDRDGTIITLDDETRLGLWVMPDNELNGILEDFIAYMVPPGDAVWAEVRSFVGGLPDELRQFPPRRRSKAEIHAYLAVQDEPGKPLGQAITARYLDPGCAEATRFVDWLRRLFDA